MTEHTKFEGEVKCWICGKAITGPKTVWSRKPTCPSKKVKNGRYEKSVCQKISNARYQKEYREKQKKLGIPARQHKYRKNTRQYKNKHINKTNGEHIEAYIQSHYTYKTRNCLKCNKEFSSQGPHNRICNPCNGENTRVFHKEKCMSGTSSTVIYDYFIKTSVIRGARKSGQF